jgi:predicted TIM-barrel fold metal-dependent hydrolase
VKECVERVGASRLIWGTDMPMVARFCTYRQSMDQFRVHCDFLSDAERADILGGTVARVMGIDVPSGTP